MRNQKLLEDLKDYLDKHMSLERETRIYSNDEPVLESMVHLEEYIAAHRQQSFSEVLFKFIDDRGLEDADVYKKAGIDRRHFSKIRTNPDYQVSKKTGIALALALELNEEKTGELLSAAGFSLSGSGIFDLIIRFFLEIELYDIDEIDEALVHFDLEPIFS